MAKKSKMNKQRIAVGVSIKTPLNLQQAKIATDAVFEILSAALQLGDAIEIRGFGSFKLVERAGRTGRNPRTGEPVIVGPKTAVKFRVSKEIKL
jgi:nucleoid DNA-binding protein